MPGGWALSSWNWGVPNTQQGLELYCPLQPELFYDFNRCKPKFCGSLNPFHLAPGQVGWCCCRCPEFHSRLSGYLHFVIERRGSEPHLWSPAVMNLHVLSIGLPVYQWHLLNLPEIMSLQWAVLSIFSIPQ